MNTDSNFYQSIAFLALATASLLLIPLVAMQFSTGVVWTLSDFVVAGTLLFGTGFSYILVTRMLVPRMGDDIIYRIAIGFALFTGLFLIWTNLAVGIIGAEDNPANLMYFGVPVVGIIGAFIARFRPQGMALTMIWMALAQALATGIALTNGMHRPVSSAIHALGVNGFFIALFVVSAFLFWYAARRETPTNNSTED